MNSLRSRITQILYEEDLHKPLNACCIETFNAHYPCDALEVCKRTIENHSAWMEARKLRITGTRCYSLYTFAKGNWAKKALEYFRAEPFKGNWATRYGEAQEASAREAYRFFIREWGEVQKYGVAICQFNPWLGCSPYGVVIKNGQPFRLLEIKCPVVGSAKSILSAFQN